MWLRNAVMVSVIELNHPPVPDGIDQMLIHVWFLSVNGPVSGSWGNGRSRQSRVAAEWVGWDTDKYSAAALLIG